MTFETRGASCRHCSIARPRIVCASLDFLRCISCSSVIHFLRCLQIRLKMEAKSHGRSRLALHESLFAGLAASTVAKTLTAPLERSALMLTWSANSNVSSCSSFPCSRC